MYIHCIAPLFVIYLFLIHYFAYIYFAFYYLQPFIWQLTKKPATLQKNPALSSGVRSVMRTTTEGGFYLRLRLENLSVVASLFEAVKVDFETFSHSLRC